MSTMLEVYDGDKNTDLVYASRYGELERVVKLIKQQIEENEISPTGFSFSVHNSTIGLFRFLKTFTTNTTLLLRAKTLFHQGFWMLH